MNVESSMNVKSSMWIMNVESSIKFLTISQGWFLILGWDDPRGPRVRRMLQYNFQGAEILADPELEEHTAVLVNGPQGANGAFYDW